ncbi:MAG: long-chain fatty acid--CoA ligase [Dehalococcoidia bacterium]|nr:MAG: long-chain fatty acid--CoA ligase [Dehalococcoidia bacterium]
MEKIWLKHYDPGVPETIDYPRVALQQLLEESANRFPKQTAIIFPGAFDDEYLMSYRDLAEKSNRLANALIDLGVKKGDRVALLLPNCPQFVISYYAVLKVGGIVVATNPLYSPREIEFQLNDCGAETIIVLSLFYKTVMGVKERTNLKNVVVTNIKEYLPPHSRKMFTMFVERQEGHRVRIPKVKNIHKFQDLLRRFDPTPPSVAVDPDDIVMFQYTGGTTGLSKAAVATHFNVLANVYQMRAWGEPLGLDEGKEVILGVMPLFHVYGMVVVMHFSVLGGAAMVLLPRWETEQVLKAINRYKPAFFPGVPTMYVALNNHPDVTKYDLRSIKLCNSGAAPLPLEVQQTFAELTGAKLSEGYGLSEAPTATHANPVVGMRKPGSIGVPLPDVEAKIMDAETGEREMSLGEVGELVIRGPQVMKGYWNRPEETEMALRKGWLYTGDLARMDEDGFFSIVDRKKEMMMASGFNIYRRDVEEVLYEHPKIKEAVCYGVPDPYRGQTVKVCIVLKEGETCTPDEITEFCQPRLARYKVPKLVEFRDELPKTLIGKVLRRVLMEEEEAKLKDANKEQVEK